MSAAVLDESLASRGVQTLTDGRGELEDAMLRWARAINLWTAYLVVAGARAGTVRYRRYQVRRLAEACIRRNPWRITTAELIAWLASHSWGAESRKSYRAALRSFYGWGVRAGHTKRNPAADLPVVRVPASSPRPAPDDVVTVAMLAASDRDRLILALAAYAGLRRLEIAELRWSDAAGGALRVRGKGGKVRTVPLHPELEELLELERDNRRRLDCGTGYRYRTGIDGPYVFPGQAAGHMSANAVGHAAARALGPGWGVHTLRHRFATRAYAGSRDLLAVQALLGHSKPETTKRYTDLDGDALVAAVRAV